MLQMRSIPATLAALVLICAGALPSSAQNHPNRNSHPNQKPSHNHSNQAAQRQSVPRPPEAPQSGHHAGQWLRRYKDVPADQQQKALNSDPQFRSLPAERQEQLRQRLQRFSSLPPQQQQRTLQRMETWEHLTPEQKADARGIFSRMRQLPPQRRQAMQNAINALRAMPPDARQRAIDSGRFSQFSPDERDMLKGVSKLPLAPPESEVPQQ